MMSVEQIGQVFVKATRFLHPESVHVDHDGIRHDRAFALVEADDKFVGSPEHSTFIPLKFNFDAGRDSLQLTLPDGRVIDGPGAADSVNIGKRNDYALVGGDIDPGNTSHLLLHAPQGFATV